MAVIKCKMCGGDLDISEGLTVCECEYCGTKQTVPTVDDEKKIALFNRAGRLLRGCEFDKAAGVFESIVADFPEEAEAYWGLVLCKFGIEYVDDPATGKKVPTCHRSGFDSVMKDADFEQACENADAIARRQYREEAKAIEELRRSIIEVSGKEEPYDIFICYKETDENGNRTIDSVLAQDVYDALTDKGYRVFFSRITLEDKLGQEYEPYIFAALNSAKIMLAFGTDFEYYNAVWVKNEWSRFLKLMAKDKGKHLIPCYKNIDAYDMPEEFARLQAQDMGKVGAMQDLLRGIEKLLPRKKEEHQPQTVVQQVVQTTGGPNVAAQIKRGQQALEDRDWTAAEGFFDKALDMDAECAEAFFGKALAAARCENGQALTDRRKAMEPNQKTKHTACERDEARIRAAVERHADIPGYYEAKSVKACFTYDERTYDSLTEGWQQRIEEEKQYWEQDRNLSRAVRYAKGPFAEELKKRRDEIESRLRSGLEASRKADESETARVTELYRAKLDEADRAAEDAYQSALRRRQTDYEQVLQRRKSANTSKDLKKITFELDRLGFRDIPGHAEQLQKFKKAAAERAEAEAAENMRREKARKAKKRRIGIIAACIAVFAVAAFFLVTRWIIPESKYRSAEALLAEGKTTAAAMTFGEAGNYKDARDRSLELWNAVADRDTIAAGVSHTVGLKSDGTVLAAGWNAYGQCDVSGWADIVAVAAGDYHTVGLKSDGTVVAVGRNRDNVSGWTDIVAVAAGGYHTVGLKSDGTVVAAGWNAYGQCDVTGWTDIVAIAAGNSHTVGLKSDGTVVAVGRNIHGQCDVTGWTDIVAVAASDSHTVGLKSDGTVVATEYIGADYKDHCDVTGWTDIVAVAANGSLALGLKSNGTVVVTGYDTVDQCNVSDWTDVVAVAAGVNHTVGLKSDGTVVTVGKNSDGQCDVSGWTDIKVPEK